MISKKLRFCAWNIQGYNSRQIGSKFQDKEFLSRFKNTDFIGLTETHVHEEVLDEMNIPGFSRLQFKNEAKNKKSNTAQKGIAVFVKEDVKHLFHLVPSDNEDIIWVKMKKEDTGGNKDVYIGTCYLNPSKGKDSDRKITKLTEDVITFQKKGDIMITGDLNAKTGNLDDFIAPDKTDELFDLSFGQPPSKRNSQDNTVNPRGKDLLDMCKSFDLNIVNGRKTGDPFGNYTCLKWNGSSVVDYLISSPQIYNSISMFNVGDFLPWLSDHCPLYFTVELFNVVRGNTPTPEPSRAKAPKQYVWSCEGKQKFLDTITTAEFQAKWDECIKIDHSDPNNAVKYISEVLISAADRAKIKCVKRQEQRDPPWFDKTCQDLKYNIKKLGKKVQREPKNDICRKELFEEKKKLKKLVKNNKLAYKNQLMDQMKQSKNDSKKFWRLLDKLEKRSNDTDFKQGIRDQRWVSHFKSIFYNPNADKPFPRNSAEQGELDQNISLQELKLGAYVLRLGKSPGFDSISNEMLLCLLEARPTILQKLFNSILQNPRTIEKWSISMINPLHKSGSKMDPDNYRGISLLSCFSKYFSAILNQRLTKFAIEKNIFSSSQLGFLSGCRTSDALLILNNLIDYYCKKRNQYIFGCFVDFKKAFDSIPRHKLFQKLLDYNINGKFYDCLVNMYSNDIACVKIADSISPSFIANQGVKQGCILSPTLFNIFLSDIQSVTETAECDPLQIKENINISCIIWADDILLMSKTEEGLKNMLSALKEYSDENGMSINMKKTQTMVFNKNGRHIRRNFYVGNEKLESTRRYKYLGFIVTPSGEIGTGLKDLKDRALRALAKLKNKLGISFRKHPLITLKLFKSLVEPILLYASDFWGILKMPINNPVENLFMSFCKQLLGVQQQTTNVGVLLELGQIPMVILAQKNAIKNWVRITTNTECNNNMINSYHTSVLENLPWFLNMEHKLSEIGMREQFLSHDKDTHLKAFQRMTDIFHQEAFSDIQRNNSKLRTYSLLKLESGFENYLCDIKSIKERTALTKFRLSNHMLMIEKGRHIKPKLDESKRVCPFCLNCVENEIHFLLKCKEYQNLRNELLVEAKKNIPLPPFQSDKQKFCALIKETPHLASQFISKASELREFLLAKHKLPD